MKEKGKKGLPKKLNIVEKKKKPVKKQMKLDLSKRTVANPTYGYLSPNTIPATPSTVTKFKTNPLLSKHTKLKQEIKAKPKKLKIVEKKKKPVVKKRAPSYDYSNLEELIRAENFPLPKKLNIKGRIMASHP